jgi:capsular polysaccharide export protein
MPQKRKGQLAILVPGQVEDSDSIRLGCVDICTNFELLSEVREKNPNAYIVYKPHPNVLSGKGKGDIPKEVITSLCDYVALDQDMDTCLETADQVHTITSLVGFGALLRGKQVYTYGLPFYAGWGLTLDRHSAPRRQRKCTLDRLVYCSLVLYPRYHFWELGCFVEVEDILRSMEAQARKQLPFIDLFGLNQLYRKAAFLLKDFKALLAGA